MKKTLILAAAAIMLSASCTTVKKTADSVDVPNTVHSYPVVADLKIGKKVTATKDWTNHPFKASMSAQVGRGNLVAETLEENHADVILEPKFIIERTGFPFFEKYHVVVTGYLGNYNGFRNATEDDLRALETVKDVPQEGTVKYNEFEGFKLFRR